MRKILVTGGNGFVGRRFRERADRGLEDCRVFCPASSEMNLLDYVSTEAFIRKNEIDMVIHLAAVHGGVELSQNQPQKLLEENTVININMVKAAVQNGVEKFITFGSSCSYGLQSPLPIKEEYLWHERPENTYGVAKLVMLEQLCTQNRMNWVYFIPTNIYGSGDHFGAVNMHIIPANILKFENARSCGRDYIDVWGDGSQVRDFVYVDDIVSLILEGVHSSKYDNDIYNVSTNEGVTIKRVIEIIQEVMEADDIQIRWDTTKPTGILKKVCDNTKIKSVSPDLRFTSIEEGLRNTIREHQERNG